LLDNRANSGNLPNQSVCGNVLDGRRWDVANCPKRPRVDHRSGLGWADFGEMKRNNSPILLHTEVLIMAARRHSSSSSSRSFVTLAVLSLASFAALPAAPSLGQQDEAVPSEANAKFNFAGTINANAVYVRSGPGENYYATMKLDQGAAVTVVGIKFDWLKVTPPDGSYSYVAKQYVTKTGEGKGVVERSDLNVRAGSVLNDLKTTVQTKLDQGMEVKILGEKDEYWKIAPPAGTFLYIKKEFVTPGKPLPVPNGAGVTDAAPLMETPIVSEPVKPVENRVAEATPAAPTVPASEAVVPASVVPATQPVAEGATPSTQPVAEAAPSTQPAKLSASAQFDKLETEFLAFSKQPIDQQPLATAHASYEALAADPKLPESMRRVVDVRVATLKTRLEVSKEFIATREAQKAADERKKILEAERQELADRLEKNRVTIYSAVGTLRTSSLQTGPQMLYRLTDPATGRTLVYLRTDDVKYGTLIGQFIGVQGEVTTDPAMNLKFITPTETAQIDPATVGTTVTAQLLPQSIIEARGGTADLPKE
jgi:uncharacterized protein YgiM (DUF1202 family)